MNAKSGALVMQVLKKDAETVGEREYDGFLGDFVDIGVSGWYFL